MPQTDIQTNIQTEITTATRSVIQTRWRDISFEDATRCKNKDYWPVARRHWARLRGQPVQIVIPPMKDGVPIGHGHCMGPYYQLAETFGQAERRWACIHQLEIGD